MNLSRTSHPAAVPSLHVTWRFLRKYSLISSACCLAARDPAQPPHPASAEPPLLPVHPEDSSSTVEEWRTSTPWFSPDFLFNLPLALALRLFWHQVPPSRSKNTNWPAVLISVAVAEKRCLICSLLLHDGAWVIWNELTALRRISLADWCWGAPGVRQTNGAAEETEKFRCEKRMSVLSDEALTRFWWSLQISGELYSVTIWIGFPPIFPRSSWDELLTTHHEGRYWTASGEEKSKHTHLLNIFRVFAHTHHLALSHVTGAGPKNELSFPSYLSSSPPPSSSNCNALI